MNATVTKNTKKTPPKAAATTRAKPIGKTAASKPATKSPVNKATAAAKKTAKPAAKAVKKPAIAAKNVSTKTTPKPKASSVVKVTAKAKPIKSDQPKTKAVVKKTAVAARKSAPVPVKPTKDVSRPKAAVTPSKTVAKPMDEIESSEVSKVRKVATKNSKSAPSSNPDGSLLSEAQILKMGEKDYMSRAQLDFFKHRLQQLEKDLLKNADETTEHLRETVLVPDPADRATIEEEHALELRTRDRERKLLKKVQQSIASIDTGEYGWCEETGEPIGVPRLLARPTATLSLEAQQRRELKQKLYGD